MSILRMEGLMECRGGREEVGDGVKSENKPKGDRLRNLVRRLGAVMVMCLVCEGTHFVSMRGC